MFEEVKHLEAEAAVDLPAVNGTATQINGTVGQVDSPEPGQQPTEAALRSPSPQHAEAGRKGAFRIHELVRLGKSEAVNRLDAFNKLYEQEHGLKRGRQRRRQLIEEGKLYEQEHGLSPRRKRRTPRLKPQQVLKGLLQTLWHVARPKYRPDLRRLLEVLDSGQA